MTDRSLDLLIERFERLERDVEELKRASRDVRTIVAPTETGPPIPQVAETSPAAPEVVGPAEAFVLGTHVPDALDFEESVVGSWFPRLEIGRPHV